MQITLAHSREAQEPVSNQRASAEVGKNNIAVERVGFDGGQGRALECREAGDDGKDWGIRSKRQRMAQGDIIEVSS